MSKKNNSFVLPASYVNYTTDKLQSSLEKDEGFGLRSKNKKFRKRLRKTVRSRAKRYRGFKHQKKSTRNRHRHRVYDAYSGIVRGAVKMPRKRKYESKNITKKDKKHLEEGGYEKY